MVTMEYTHQHHKISTRLLMVTKVHPPIPQVESVPLGQLQITFNKAAMNNPIIYFGDFPNLHIYIYIYIYIGCSWIFPRILPWICHGISHPDIPSAPVSSPPSTPWSALRPAGRSKGSTRKTGGARCRGAWRCCRRCCHGNGRAPGR